MAPLKRMLKESSEWAKLEPACSMKISDFIDSLGMLQEPLYLFDWSVPTYAPELAKELTIPKYFAGDFLQRTAPGSLYKESWPSLFIAPQGLHSDLHVDAFGSNFWMALFQGRKRSRASKICRLYWPVGWLLPGWVPFPLKWTFNVNSVTQN